MGHEAKLQSVPIDHPLVQSWLGASEDPGEQIQQMFFRLGEMRRGMNPAPFFASAPVDYQQYQQRIMALAQQYPWIVAGFIDLDRIYDYVIYMLECWSEGPGEWGLAAGAVLGFQQVAGRATASQGRAIQWSTPEQVAQVYAFLKRIEQKKTLPPLSLERIPPERYFYKRLSETRMDDPETRRGCELAISSRFRPLLKFYQGARQSGFGVIAVRD